ncbi:RhoGAP domain containing protein [Entamoeba histolytica HM-1:IMSS]|uniref:RhoGAP domain containing protein n=2 Tax=Entamoeba histolytica TaxID=5759 RepID=C4LUD2_ENTH1|nr:RhoGAP domain containing protein [Entamoeba histolytica HM-1:IMSS]EAL44385.2 RhoGAP domain containing protein [Entamoeba histolytica HM-1:IMSS]EMD48218.1 RhoGAP domain containing protein [Entamoeba histolytica KU27]|eukprot:XP_649774.2 RhoGAP domain containing protein [Entamoeba histolytica HM-1:IMSS]
MESIVVTSHRKSFSTDNVNEGTDLKSPKPSSNNGSLVGTEESPRLLSPRDPTHRHHIMDDKTKSLITFLEKTKRPSQRVTTSHAMVMAAKRRALLTNCNKRYGKKIEILESCRRPTIGFSDDLIQQSLQISFDAMKQTEEIMKENIFEMNQFFSEMSPKKILRMYDTVASSITQESLSAVVDYSYDDSKPKQKKIILRSNFFVISSINSQYKEVIYLNNPSVLKEGETTLIINGLTKVKFNSNEVCDQWEHELNNLSIWVESIPRTVINEESSSSNLGGLDKVDIMPTPRIRPSLSQIKENETSNTSNHIRPSLPGNYEEMKRHTKKRSIFGRKDKEEKDKKEETKNEKIAFFGITLEDYGNKFKTQTIPPPIKELIQYLYVNGSTTEGIFRICGNQDTIQKIKTKLECNEKNFFSSFDIYSLASTLKQYIREFPSQVISPDIDREFLDLYKHSYSIGKSEMADDQILEEYLRIFAKLPPIIKDFIENLTKLLSQVLQHASTNKMNLANIFICLGPALRGCPFCFNYATVHHSEIFCSTKQQEETKESIKEEKKEGEENNNSIPQ